MSSMKYFNIRLNESLDLRKGDILLSEPMLLDPNFHRSVIFICEHDDDKGSFGLVINRPFHTDINPIEEIFFADKQLFIGGPVEQQTLHFIHKIDDLAKSIPLKNGYYWGGDFEMLKAINLQGGLAPSNCRFLIGYSRWEKQQLRNELLQNSWIISRNAPEKLFEVNPENMWKYILEEMGGKYRVFINYPADPDMN